MAKHLAAGPGFNRNLSQKARVRIFYGKATPTLRR
jgi:hypothetical protein